MDSSRTASIACCLLGLTDVARIADEPIPKYRQVNYEAMREMIDERKRIGSQALQRGR